MDRARSGVSARQLAKALHPNGLDLWTFQSNVGARHFYEWHGFAALETTDGANEEGAPDVHYRWPSTRRRLPPPPRAPNARTERRHMSTTRRALSAHMRSCCCTRRTPVR